MKLLWIISSLSCSTRPVLFCRLTVANSQVQIFILMYFLFLCNFYSYVIFKMYILQLSFISTWYISHFLYFLFLNQNKVKLIKNPNPNGFTLQRYALGFKTSSAPGKISCSLFNTITHTLHFVCWVYRWSHYSTEHPKLVFFCPSECIHLPEWGMS